MKKNPAKESMNRRRINVGRVIETLKESNLRITLANLEYSQGMKRTWRDFENGSRKAS